MKTMIVQLKTKSAAGYEIPLPKAPLVVAATETGVLGCGYLDMATFDKLQVPAARMSGVATVDELLAKPVQIVNQAAQALGVQPGMSGRDALERM